MKQSKLKDNIFGLRYTSLFILSFITLLAACNIQPNVNNTSLNQQTNKNIDNTKKSTKTNSFNKIFNTKYYDNLLDHKLIYNHYYPYDVSIMHIFQPYATENQEKFLEIGGKFLGSFSIQGQHFNLTEGAIYPSFKITATYLREGSNYDYIDDHYFNAMPYNKIKSVFIHIKAVSNGRYDLTEESVKLVLEIPIDTLLTTTQLYDANVKIMELQGILLEHINNTYYEVSKVNSYLGNFAEGAVKATVELQKTGILGKMLVKLTAPNTNLTFDIPVALSSLNFNVTNDNGLINFDVFSDIMYPHSDIKDYKLDPPQHNSYWSIELNRNNNNLQCPENDYAFFGGENKNNKSITWDGRGGTYDEYTQQAEPYLADGEYTAELCAYSCNDGAIEKKNITITNPVPSLDINVIQPGSQTGDFYSFDLTSNSQSKWDFKVYSKTTGQEIHNEYCFDGRFVDGNMKEHITLGNTLANDLYAAKLSLVNRPDVFKEVLIDLRNNKRAINSCEDIPSSKSKAESANNIQKNIVQQVKGFNRMLPRPASFTTKSVESDNTKNLIIQNLSELNKTKTELESLVNSIALSSDPAETEIVNEPDVNIADPNINNLSTDIEQHKQKLELLTTDFNTNLGKVSKANSENIIKAMRVLTQEISLYETVVNEYLAIAETKPKDIIPLIARVSGRINNHLTRINKISFTQMDETQRQDLANQYNEVVDNITLYEEYAQAIQAPDSTTQEDESFQTQSFSIKKLTYEDQKDQLKSELNRAISKEYNRTHPYTPWTQTDIILDGALNTAVDAALLYAGPPSTKSETAIALSLALSKLAPEAINAALHSPRVLKALTKTKAVIKEIGNGFRFPPNAGGMPPCFCFAEMNTLSKAPEQAKKFFSNTSDKLKNFFKSAGRLGGKYERAQRSFKASENAIKNLSDNFPNNTKGLEDLIQKIKSNQKKLKETMEQSVNPNATDIELNKIKSSMDGAMKGITGNEGEVTTALKLKNEGKNIIEFGRDITDPLNKTDIDLVTKEIIGGVEKEVLHQIKTGEASTAWDKFGEQLEKTARIAKQSNPKADIVFHYEKAPRGRAIQEIERLKTDLANNGINLELRSGVTYTNLNGK